MISNTQLMHIRNARTVDGALTILPHGGYTLAFRCIQRKDEGVKSYHLEYAIAECSEDDLYRKSTGIRLAKVRCENLSPKHFHIAPIPATPEPSTGLSEYPVYLIEENDDHNVVDIRTDVLNLRHLIIDDFVRELFDCSPEDVGVRIGNKFFIDTDTFSQQPTSSEEIIEDLESLESYCTANNMSDELLDKISAIQTKMFML